MYNQHSFQTTAPLRRSTLAPNAAELQDLMQQGQRARSQALRDGWRALTRALFTRTSDRTQSSAQPVFDRSSLAA